MTAQPVPPRDELRAYRDRTIALLRRYFMLSIETGRLPSLLGREFFRAKCSSYRLVTFEDVVIIVHDVEQCLERLHKLDQKIICHIVFEDFTQDEAARILRVTCRTVERRYPEALDDLTEMFIRGGLLRLIYSTPSHQKSCQGGQNLESSATA